MAAFDIDENVTLALDGSLRDHGHSVATTLEERRSGSTDPHQVLCAVDLIATPDDQQIDARIGARITMKPFVPRDFTVPTLVETDRFRIRPLTNHDVVKDYDAVMTSQEHLRLSLPWGWPPPDLTLEQDLIDLGWHQKEFQMETSFDYAVPA